MQVYFERVEDYTSESVKSVNSLH